MQFSTRALLATFVPFALLGAVYVYVGAASALLAFVASIAAAVIGGIVGVVLRDAWGGILGGLLGTSLALTIASLPIITLGGFSSSIDILVHPQAVLFHIVLISLVILSALLGAMASIYRNRKLREGIVAIAACTTIASAILSFGGWGFIAWSAPSVPFVGPFVAWLAFSLGSLAVAAAGSVPLGLIALGLARGTVGLHCWLFRRRSETA